MQVRITRLHDDVTLPVYATDGSVAFDLAPIEQITIQPHQSAHAPTGLVIQTPPGYALIIAPRSSLFRKKGIRLGNTIGIVDQDFCGPQDELLLFLWNATDQPVTIEKGERIAQGLFVAIAKAEWTEETNLQHPSRGGWGSTGGYI